MTGATLLLRQVHPTFVQGAYATSQAFRPTPKDISKLSVYDGDLIAPEASWVHYTTVWKLASVGVMAVSVDDCSVENLPTCSDPLPDCAEHVVIDFTGLPDKECYRKSKKLQAKAQLRGWLYQAGTGS